MIVGFTQCGKPDEAIAVFKEMNQVQEKSNAITILNLLEACSVSAELKRLKWAHGIAIRRGLVAEVAVGTAILDMYSKCGAIEALRKTFNHIPKKNRVSWSAMISGYGMNGLTALALLAEMKLEGLKPNAVTLISMLSTCSHGGLVEEGISIFKEMVQDYGIEPKPNLELLRFAHDQQSLHSKRSHLYHTFHRTGFVQPPCLYQHTCLKESSELKQKPKTHFELHNNAFLERDSQ